MVLFKLRTYMGRIQILIRHLVWRFLLIISDAKALPWMSGLVSEYVHVIYILITYIYDLKIFLILF